MNLKDALVFSLIAAFSVYSGLSLVWGTQGYVDYGKLENYRDSLVKNLAVLESENESITKEYSALRTSREMVKVRARKLMYFGEDEGFIYYSPVRSEERASPVKPLLRRPDPIPDRSNVIRAASLAVFLVSLLLWTARSFGSRKT